MAAGKVALVGAGPGHPGLLTERGRQVLGEADAIVFDRSSRRAFWPMPGLMRH
ncbi:hypothetical protein GCM10025858_11800 [Alicyclobacillus sacchari]|nr:SAM-dependent methyltransferase [Alicyclobacillus sacchari]GMA56677.1 hypothetical protein GCM10025858_11800 [Alicyclobacillus sacchari]